MTTVVRERGLRARMADGVELVADAWYPSAGGPFPVLLQRLPYGRSVASAPVLPHPVWFARRGYAVVIQDVRGRDDSGGNFSPYVHEADDGAATVEWAAGLPFSSGAVGMYGFSYQGIAQLLAAARRPPSLKAVAPMMCGLDPFEGWMYHGGCRNWPNLAGWAAQIAAQEPGPPPREPDLGALPIDRALGDHPPPWFLEWLEHDADGAYWEERRVGPDQVEVPVFTVLGWFDYLATATSRLATALDAEVVAGPWSHMPWGSRAGEVELGPDASPAHAHEALLAFLDRHLKGLHPADPPARVRYLPVWGTWRTASAWPPPADELVLGLTSGGNANSRHGDGRLSPAGTDPGPADVLVVEPLVPYTGALDPLEVEAPAEDRRDVLCFSGEELASDLEVTGIARATIVTLCDQPTHDVVVSLVVVDATGTPRRLATGATRVRGVAPGEARRVAVDLRPLSVVLHAGERLRVDVSGGRFPAYDRNPHVAASHADRDAHVVATLEVLGGTVVLPVVQTGQADVR